MGRPVLPISEPSHAEVLAFFDRVDRSAGRAACWPWTGVRNPQGYGVARIGGRQMNASRAAWFLEHGPILEGHYVLHHCDRPECVNPRHLFTGTQRENVADMDRKGRRARGYRISDPHRGEHHQAAKLTDEQVEAIRVLRAAGWTQRRIGSLMGISHTHVGLIEQGRLRAG